MTNNPTTEQPTAEQAYDRRIAEGIRYAVGALNAAIDEAQEAGIQVHFGVSVWTGLRPQKSHVDNLRIERPADWRHDYPGEKL